VAITRLGLIETTLSKYEPGLARFEKAWGIFSKNRKKPGYQNSRVLRAAARAQYEIAEAKRRKDLPALSQAAKLNRKQFASLVQEIEAGYWEAMKADRRFTPRCEHGIGNLHTDFADVLVKDGYRKISASGFASSPAPCRSGRWPSEHLFAPQILRTTQILNTLNTIGAIRRWIGDCLAWTDFILYTIAGLMSCATGAIRFANGCRRVQYDMLIDDIFPLAETLLSYRGEAMKIGRLIPDRYAVSELEKTVDRDIRTPFIEYTSLCRSQWSATRSTATQISRMITATKNPATVATLRETVGVQIELSNRFGEESFTTLETLLEAAQECDSTTFLRTAWHVDAVQLFLEFAELNRSVSENLAMCLPELDPFDPIAVTLSTRLSDLSREAASNEYRTLESAHRFATEWKAEGKSAHQVYKRLAELNPTAYPPVLQGVSANR
jgi:hypothetical protein